MNMNSRIEPLPPGTKIEKIHSVPDDAHKNGATGRVVRAVNTKNSIIIGYFVVWDDMPGVPVFIRSSRIREVLV